MDFSDAHVCLFDPVNHNLAVTRAALVDMGFVHVDGIADYISFAKSISNNSYDLIIAETHDAGGAVSDLLRMIRAGETGINPYVVTVATSWKRDHDHLQAIVDAGADDIMLRPFSTEALRMRISLLTRSRKQFVVTSDYVGPDRRLDQDRKTSVDAFVPPNTLKATVEKDHSALMLAEKTIEKTRADVARERIRRLASKLVITMQVKILDPKAGKKIDMEDVDAIAREFRRRLRSEKIADALELATALTEVTTGMLGPEIDDEEHWVLARELSLGAYLAYSGGEGIDKESDEIRSGVETVRRKLHSRKASG